MRVLGAVALFCGMAAWSHYCWAGNVPTEELYATLKAILGLSTI